MPGRIVTPAEAIRRLGDFDKKRLRQAIRTGMAAGARKALQQARAEAEIKSRGLGRSLWGKRKALSHKKYMETFSPGKKARRRAGKFFAPGVAPLILEVSKIRTFGDRFRGGIQAVGVAANIVAGKPTKPHTITMSRGGTIRHPGGRVPRNPVIQRRAPKFPREAGAAIQSAVWKAALKRGLVG